MRIVRGSLNLGDVLGLCTRPKFVHLLSDGHFLPANQATGIPSSVEKLLQRTRCHNNVSPKQSTVVLRIVGLHSSLTQCGLQPPGCGQTRARRRDGRLRSMSTSLPLHSYSPNSGSSFDSAVVLAPTIGRPGAFVLPWGCPATPKAEGGVSPGGGRGGMDMDGGGDDALPFFPCPWRPGSLAALLHGMHVTGFHA